ncbi:MAG: sulfatase-like hydrolase/transferase [Planctomycetaceae bacterium]|nr:sulfatase-like hydrolase/transferase [Planctomycetaceae bacterium]
MRSRLLEYRRFDRCFCTNSICGPSRAVILTGAYSHINGFRRNGDRFDGTQTTFPRLMRDAGYQTAIVGKWHLECEPSDTSSSTGSMATKLGNRTTCTKIRKK